MDRLTLPICPSTHPSIHPFTHPSIHSPFHSTNTYWMYHSVPNILPGDSRSKTRHHPFSPRAGRLQKQTDHTSTHQFMGTYKWTSVLWKKGTQLYVSQVTSQGCQPRSLHPIWQPWPRASTPMWCNFLSLRVIGGFRQILNISSKASS